MLLDKCRQAFLSVSKFSAREKLFFLFAMAAGFLISADYAIIRSVSNSLFIHAYGASAFPYAWLVSIPLNLIAVSLYNYCLPKFGCFPVFLVSAAMISLGNAVCVPIIDKFSFLPFVLYVWKELYVMLMFQQLWSVIHASTVLRQAKYLYGILFGIGALGGFCGSLLPSFGAVEMGSEVLLLSSLPIYLLLTWVYFGLLKYSQKVSWQEMASKGGWHSISEGFRLIGSSRLLMAILGMVCFMQIAATLTDFQFHAFLEAEYPEKDLRTAFIGKISCIGNILTMTFQFVGVFLLIHYLGLQRAHFFVPFMLALNALAFMIFPVFGLITCCFVVIKCLDFSIFGVIKEMLYVPMRQEEKFHAKAVIDVFMYRTAKAIASLGILWIQWLALGNTAIFSSINLLIFCIWCIVVFSLRESYKASEGIPVE